MRENDSEATEILDGIDFIDMGASTGGSLLWASKAFGGNGLGVDISERKAIEARKIGRKVLVSDARSLNLPSKSVRFSTLIDFLEHLPDLDAAMDVVKSACRISREFIYIALPNFDNEEYLINEGLKRYYADWTGHTLHLKSNILRDMFKSIEVNAKIYLFNEIFDSFDRNILPASAPRNSQVYDPAIHERKKFIIFPRKRIYSRTIAIAKLSPEIDTNKLMMDAMTSIGYLRNIRE